MYSTFAAVGLLLRRRDVLGAILREFVVADRAIPLPMSDALVSYEAESCIWGDL
jgi:hypothetical protein